ncbi:MAG: SLC13 family permease [Halioglobus sp.]
MLGRFVRSREQEYKAMIAAMSTDAWITLLVVGLSLACLVSNRFSPEIVLVGALSSLLLVGVLDTSQALAGFANPGLVTVAVLYVVVAGLVDTGAVQAFGARLLGKPRSIAGAQARLMLPVMGVSAFLNNTPVVAMFVPVVGEWCRRHQLSVSKLMLPLSYAAIFGGCCTLIGTSTNLIVHGLVLEQTALGPMGFFDIAAVGLPVALVGFAYVLVTQRWLLPERIPPLHHSGSVREYTIEFMVAKGSALVGKSIEERACDTCLGCSCRASGAMTSSSWRLRRPSCCWRTIAWCLSARSTRWWNWCGSPA